MSTAALNSIARSALGELVDREAFRVGSRMLAYHNIAKRIGMSTSWVRKFIADTNEVAEPRITLFQNIRASYESLCSRVEQENRDDERRLRLIKGEIDAVTEGFISKAEAQDQTRVGED